MKKLKRNLTITLITATTLTLFQPYETANAICNHNWVIDTNYGYEATCSSKGSRWYVCSLCGEDKQEVIPATGMHKWSEWEVWNKATCTENGEEARECSECYETEKKVIPATGVHKWAEWKADGYLCEDGKDTRYCTECYKEETRVRKSDGSHLWSDWETDTEPDCMNDGKDYRKCYNCYTYEYRDVPADEDLHDWSIWWDIDNATALSKGKAERHCYICDTVETKITDKLDAKIALSAKKKTLKAGKAFRLLVKRYTYGDLLKGYKSSNKNVAVVRDTGWVTAMKKGKATITVTMKSGCKAKCHVIVK